MVPTVTLFLIAVVIVAFAAVYAIFNFRFKYWKRLGVLSSIPTFPFGNIDCGSIQLAFRVQELYQQFKNNTFPFFGIYFLHQPWAVLTDLELIKNVLVRDFKFFQDRGLYENEKDDPLSAHLSAVGSKKWRRIRPKLSPTFTSGKMRLMYPTMIEVCGKFKKCLAGMVKESGEIELKEVLTRFTTDLIGTCAFGIECNSLVDPSAEFRRMGKKAFSEPRYSAMVINLIRSMKTVSRRLGLKVFPDDVSAFFMSVVRQTVSYREENGITRNDFMDLMIKTRHQGEDPLTVEEIAAQSFLFILAGFENSATTLTFLLYELALHKDIQTKARDEIKLVLKKHEGNFSYDAMMDMPYIDQVINGK